MEEMVKELIVELEKLRKENEMLKHENDFLNNQIIKYTSH